MGNVWELILSHAEVPCLSQRKASRLERSSKYPSGDVRLAVLCDYLFTELLNIFGRIRTYISFNSYVKALDFTHLILRENTSTSRFGVLQKLQT